MKKRIVSMILLMCFLLSCVNIAAFAQTTSQITIVGPATVIKPVDGRYSKVKYTLEDGEGNSITTGITWTASEGIAIMADGSVVLHHSEVEGEYSVTNGTYTITATLADGSSDTHQITVKSGINYDFETTDTQSQVSLKSGFFETDNTGNQYVTSNLGEIRGAIGDLPSTYDSAYRVNMSTDIRSLKENFVLEYDIRASENPPKDNLKITDFITINKWKTNKGIFCSYLKSSDTQYHIRVKNSSSTAQTDVEYGNWLNIKYDCTYDATSDYISTIDVYLNGVLYSSLSNLEPMAKASADSTAPYAVYGLMGVCDMDNVKVYTGEIFDPSVAPYKYEGIKICGKDAQSAVDSYPLPRKGDNAQQQYTLVSFANCDITSEADWSVSSSGEGVTISDDGMLTVDKDTTLGDYTIQASVAGKTATRQINVNKEDFYLVAEGEKSEIVREHGFTSETFASEAKDQNGTSALASWELKTAADGIYIDASTGEVTVTDAAEDGEYTVVATANEDEGFKTEGGKDKAEYTFKVSSKKYNFVLSGDTTAIIPDDGSNVSKSYTAVLVNQADDQDVIDLDESDITWTIHYNPENATINDGVFTLDANALNGLYTIEANYGKYSKTISVNVTGLTYDIVGNNDADYNTIVLPISDSAYYQVPYVLKTNAGNVLSQVTWSSDNAEILADGRLITSSSTPSIIKISAKYNGKTFTKEIPASQGTTPTGTAYTRTLTYTGLTKMSLSEGRNETVLTANAMEDGNVNPTAQIVWSVARTSDGIGSNVSVSGSKLVVNGVHNGTVYVVGKIKNTPVSTGEIAITLVDGYSSLNKNSSELTLVGSDGETFNVKHYGPATTNFIDAVLGTDSSSTDTVLTANSDGTVTHTFDFQQYGMHKVIIENSSNEVEEYYVMVNDDKLFEQTAQLRNLLKDDRINEYHAIYSGANTQTIEKATQAYVALGGDSIKENLVIKLSNGGYRRFFASVFMIDLLTENTSNISLLKSELTKLGLKTAWIDYLLKDNDMSTICANTLSALNISPMARTSSASLENAISLVTEQVILNGIANSSTTNTNEAIVYLELAGLTATSEVAAAVAGNTYANVDTDLAQAVEDALNSSGEVDGDGFGNVTQSGSFGGSAPASPVTPVVPGVYKDVTTDYWAYDYIKYLTNKGIVNGYEGNYQPEANVTRAEFVKMLTQAFNVATASVHQFADVNENDWFAPYVAGAYNAGLVLGDAGNFNPNMPITRQDAAVMIYRFASHYGIVFNVAESSFVDKNSISAYAAQSIDALSASNIINGKPDGTFAPMLNATRAEAAKMIYGAMAKGGIQ